MSELSSLEETNKLYNRCRASTLPYLRLVIKGKRFNNIQQTKDNTLVRFPNILIEYLLSIQLK